MLSNKYFPDLRSMKVIKLVASKVKYKGMFYYTKVFFNIEVKGNHK